MSHYNWSDMNIFDNGSHLDEKDVPSIPVPNNINVNVYLDGKFDIKLITDIVKFINTYNELPSGNISRLSKDSLTNFIDNNGAIVIATDDKHDIVGVLIAHFTQVKIPSKPISPFSSSIPPPIIDISLLSSSPPSLLSFPSSSHVPEIVDKDSHSCYYVNYLCVLPKFRRQSLAMILIRAALSRVREENVLLGYYLSGKSHHRGSVAMKPWFRPLDYMKAVRAGFLTTSKTLSRSLDRERILHEIRIPIGYKIERIRTPETHSLLLNELKESNMSYFPDETIWSNNIKYMNFYHIYRSGKIVAFAMLCNNSYYISSSDSIITIAHLGFLKIVRSSSPEQHLQILKTIGGKAKETGATVLSGYIIGDLSERLSKEFKCYETDSVRYLEVYNIAVPINLRESYPLLF